MTHFLYLHGFASGPGSSKARYFKERVMETGREMIVPDLNNNDFEHLTLSGQLKLIDSIAGRLEGEIVLWGSSLGGLLAALYAEQNPRVSRLILMAPAFEYLERIPSRYGEEFMKAWKADGYAEFDHYYYNEKRKLHYKIMEDAESYPDHSIKRNIPALVIHGIGDETVPYEVSLAYLKKNSRAQLLLLNSDHSLGDQLETMWGHASSFLQI